MLTNQQKLEKAIAQAQSRGWMEGVELVIQTGVRGFYILLTNLSPNPVKMYATGDLLSLNDILFGTDFCEKFFPTETYCRKRCQNNFWQSHQREMLSMSESERIDFLYKHVEAKEEKTLDCSGSSFCVHCKLKQIKENTKLASNPKIIVDEPYPVEVKEIEQLEELGTYCICVGNGLYLQHQKMRELITQVNANTKAIAENKRDCKLNRN